MHTNKYDSDQSLSEEEDLSAPVENKGAEMQVFSELEKLQKNACKIDHGTNFNVRARFPAFRNVKDNRQLQTSVLMEGVSVGSIHSRSLALASVPDSDEEIVSDEEKASSSCTGSLRLCEERDSRFGVAERVEALIQLNRHTLLSSRERTFGQAGPTKPKPSLLFRFQSKNEDLPMLVHDRSETEMLQTNPLLTEELESGPDRDHQRSITNSLEIFSGRETDPLHANAVIGESDKSHNCDGTSVAGLLANLQENTVHIQESCEQPKRLRRRRKQSCFRRSKSPLSYENIDDEDSLMVGTSVADAEGAIHDSKPILQQRTMADSFHDALGAISPSGLLSEVTMHTLGVGLYDKLKQVMLSEKEKDVDFLEKPVLDDHLKDGKRCIDVRILSRSLEAKHNVCCCDIIPYKESSQLVNESNITRQCGERNLTVIFSSRICGDVDLEVGNVIRILPPWKELREQDNILLATYFSKIAD